MKKTDRRIKPSFECVPSDDFTCAPTEHEYTDAQHVESIGKYRSVVIYCKKCGKRK